mgnify:CR=1 FL=1
MWGTAPNDFTTGQYEYSFNDTTAPLDKVLGQAPDTSKKPVQVGDFGPPGFIGDGKANFKGPSGIENINIEIKGARHNDFAYRVVDENKQPLWNDNPFEPERKAREINRKTNIFMQRLYQHALADQTTPNDLQEFLESLKEKGVATY